MAAFIIAYILPEKRDTLFVWQLAVDAGLRGKGVAKKMLRHLLSRHNLKRIRYVEATVNPSNDAARALFKSLGKDCACSVDEELIFHASMFGNESHEQESLIRVGPINPVCKTLIGRKDYL